MTTPKDSASIEAFESWWEPINARDYHLCDDDAKAMYRGDFLECWQAAMRSVEPAKIVLPRTDRFDPDESSLFLAGVQYTLSSLRRLNAGAAFKIEGE